MQLKYAVSALALVASLGLTATAFAAGHKVVPGPAADPVCFKPWSADTKFFQFPNKDGPYRIALANGFVGNTWRILTGKATDADLIQVVESDDAEAVEHAMSEADKINKPEKN